MFTHEFSTGTTFKRVAIYMNMKSPPTGSEEKGFITKTHIGITEVYGDSLKFYLSYWHPDRVDLFQAVDLGHMVRFVLGWLALSGWSDVEVP